MAFASKPVPSTTAEVENEEAGAQSKIIERPEKKRLHWKGLTCASTISTSHARIILI
jgi:hypothetical protein